MTPRTKRFPERDRFHLWRVIKGWQESAIRTVLPPAVLDLAR